jgi:hypothetical protein
LAVGVEQIGTMGFSAPLGRAASLRFAVVLAIGLLGAVLLLASAGEPASAAPLVGKDGKIHACYKVKGKAKGTLRVVRSAKVKCPKRWKKVAWNAGGPAGPVGATGEVGARGDTGLPGRNENVVVNELEDKVTELLTKVQSLESALALTNAQLAIVCAQAETLTGQSNALRTVIGGISVVGALLTVPALPAALPAFTSC